MSEPLSAESIIADLLCQALMRAHEAGRRHLYIWEARGLAWLVDNPTVSRNAWTGDRVRAYAEGRPILPGWSPDPYPIDYVRKSGASP